MIKFEEDKIKRLLVEIENHDVYEEFDFSELFETVLLMESAMIKFIRRVEEGSIRSNKTYASFKEILGIEGRLDGNQVADKGCINSEQAIGRGDGDPDKTQILDIPEWLTRSE